MEVDLETARTEDFADDFIIEVQGDETERQEVEDLPAYDDAGSGGDSLSDDDLNTEDCEVCNPEIDEEEAAKEAKTTWTEQVQMIHLRRYIDQLAEKVKDKEYEVAKSREELKKCNDRMEHLELEKRETIRQMHSAETTTNTSASYRLRAQHDRICEEMENETELKVKIKAVLDKAEYQLSQSKVEQGKYLLKEDELQKREDKLLREKTDMAQFRNNKEQKYAQNYVKQHKKDQRMNFLADEERERSLQHAIYQAEKSQERHSQHLSRTVSKIKQREMEEEERQKEHLQRRMETMLQLKKDISSNRENLRALQARDRAVSKTKKTEEDQLIQDILSEGGNPAQYLTKRSTVEQFEKQKQQHQAKQRERQVEIAAKILQEEDRIRRRKEQQPQLWQDPQKEKAKVVKPHKKRKLRVFEDNLKDSRKAEDYEIDYTKFEGKTGDESDEDTNHIMTSGMSRENTFIPDSDSDHEDAAVMAKPEFEGMWDQHKPYEVPKDIETGPKLPGASKMEKEIMSRVLDKHKENIVIKQVAAGREFKGYPFYSKPAVVHFKDFDVGKTYKKKVILTNVSYSVNYCKLIGITEHLKDFIHIDFDPPGQMSAGLTCEMLVTFKPMINEDLEGEVKFLAQTGPFTVPLQCTTKKCDLSVDTTQVDFSTSVIGETLKRTVVLTNNGALGTKFEFFKLTGMKQRTLTTAETSLGRLTTADTMRNVSPDSGDGKGKDKGGMGKKKEEDEKKDEEKPAEEGEDQPQDSTINKDGEDAEEEDIPEIDGGSSMAVDHMEDLTDLDGMRVGNTIAGDIGPFCSVKLDIVWQPTLPGKVDVEFCVSFTDPDSENIVINSVANAIDVPVWVERQTVDLKICMFDRLYQDTIIVNNRATTALRLKFEVCKELRNHLELLPKTGYIQAQSQFSAQLKFLPRKSLFEDAGKYFDRETGVLEAPMIITVADQTRPVPFTVHAVVTNSDMEFDVKDIDFGCCTIYEAVKKTVQLTNDSILSQQFGFIGLPEYVDVQPNDGFGTLLPLETVELDIIFQPKKAGEFNFELTCKSLINRTFKIKCHGVGVHPPLELSHQVIHFAATTLNDVSSAAFHVVNSHTSMNEFSHPVPRIGKGEIAPVGPTSFEFVVPEEAPFTISPSVGTVMPGEKSRIQIRFTPQLSEDEIVKEAVRMISKQKEAEALEEYKKQQLLLQQQELEAAKGPAGKGSKPQAQTSKTGKSSAGKKKGDKDKEPVAMMQIKGPAPIQPPDPDAITKDSNAYNAAHASLLRQFRGSFGSFTVPCYIASGKCAKPGELEYSVHNTLYLNVHCPAIRPQLVAISDNGRTITDFGDISIGQSVIESITIQNISDKPIDLHSSILDPEGPFMMVNALRLLPPDASHTILVGFTPHKGAMFQEVLKILAPTSTLHITLKGKGVSPMINLSVQDGLYDFGAVIATEYREETFKIENTSALSIEYCIKLDSQSLLRYSKQQGIPQFVKRDTKTKSLVGSQNNNGQQVFDCVPANGIIPKAGAVEITVTFAPDHPSDYFSDGVRIDLFGQEEQHIFQIKGVAKPHIMFIEGSEVMTPDVESLAILPVEDTEEPDAKPAPIPLLVNVRSVAKETEFSQGSTDIIVGCVRTMAVSQKKNGEWQFDNLAPIQQLGFNVEPPKGMLEAGTKKAVSITWTPPAGYDPNKPMETSINVTLRGDISEVYRIILKGFVVSD